MSARASFPKHAKRLVDAARDGQRVVARGDARHVGLSAEARMIAAEALSHITEPTFLRLHRLIGH